MSNEPLVTIIPSGATSHIVAPALKPLTLDVWASIMAIAPAAHVSRLFGVNNPEAAAMIMMKGYELGLPFTTAFEYIHVINSKVSLSPRGALALVYQSGLLAHITVDDQPGKCTVTMQRVGHKPYTLTWGIEDAKRADLVKPDSNWTKYVANMCRWRTIGFVIDVVFPDTQGGMKRADEFGARVDDAGSVITGGSDE